MSIDILKGLFEHHFHAPPERVQRLQGELGGSGRSIVRLESGGHFRRHGLPVPEIYADDLRHGAYLEQDLGDTTLFEFLVANRAGENIAPAVVDAYIKVVQMLPRFQIEAGRDLNYKVCYPRASFDRLSISWDLNYFKYYFLRLAGIAFSLWGNGVRCVVRRHGGGRSNCWIWSAYRMPGGGWTISRMNSPEACDSAR